MLLVKASLRPSVINNIGLFADEEIPKGTITWKFDPKFDIYFTVEEFGKMTSQQQEFLQHFSSLSKKTGKYILSVDDSRFANHSEKRNNIDIYDIAGDPEYAARANRTIKKDEELLVNYRQFDSNDATSDKAYLKA